MCSEYPKIGGKVRKHLAFWRSITRDPYILDIVQGVKVPFINNKPPIQKHLPSELRMSPKEMAFVDEHIQQLIAQEFIKPLPAHIPDGWVSNIFLVPKRQGGFRLILNLRNLNKFVQYTKFRMDHVDQVIKLLRPLDWMCSLDLTQAYGSLFLHPSHQKYFQFTWRGNFYCYTTLPQGFSDSPRIFVKTTLPLMASLRRQLIDILIYIDDTFLHSHCPNVLIRNLNLTRDLFHNSGLTVNIEKSCLVPVQQMEFLGFVFNSVAYTITVTAAKQKGLLRLVSSILEKPQKPITIRLLAKVIGKIVAMFPASDDAKLNYRILDNLKCKSLAHFKSWDSKVQLTGACLKQLMWWKTFLMKAPISKSLAVPVPTIEIFTDASGFAYGSVKDGVELQGRFTEKQKKFSINTKELLAIYFALGAYASQLKDEVVHIRCDNMVAIFCVKRFGSRDVFRNRLVSKIYGLARKYNFQIVISYIPSKKNLSDRASRKFAANSIHSEWTLSDHDFKIISKLWHSPPEVDLFASADNKKCDKFVSWKPCVGAMHVDSFSMDWHKINGFLFAPFAILHSVVKKCLDDRVLQMCGIFPMWETKTWYPGLMRLAGGKVTMLPKETASRLYLPWDKSQRHPMANRLRILFANLSVNYFKDVIYQNPRLNISRSTHGVQALSKTRGRWSNIGSPSIKRKKQAVTQ